jgi:hypothetical protein
MDIKQEGRCIVSRFVILLVGVLFLFAGGCGTQDGAATDAGTTGVATLQLLSDKDTVVANSTDVATLTVRAFDASNVVVEGAIVSISTTSGALSLGTATTDVTGSATFTFDSGNVVGNQIATITASTAGVVTTKSISIVGASVSFTADRLSVGLNGVTTAQLTARVLDGSGEPVENQTLRLSATLGTFGGASQITLTTDVNGQATATYAGGSIAGTDTLTLVGPVTKTMQINRACPI